MEKVEELTKWQKDEEKILIAKVLDKLKISQKRKKFENTDFLDLAQKKLIEDILIKRKESNFKFFGGFDEAERTILILIPKIEYSSYDENEKDISNIYLKQFDNICSEIMSVIRVTLPKEMRGMYEHKNYLGAIMKLGVKREKVGDILVRNDGADIIILKEIEKYLLNNLQNLTRFSKSVIENVKLKDIKYIKNEKEKFKINVPSMRLDAIVGEIARISRNEASTYIMQERVFINFKEEIRNTRQIIEGDIITIRGKGRFMISKILGETKNKRINLEIEKW